MKNKITSRYLFVILLISLLPVVVKAQREKIRLNDNWSFYRSPELRKDVAITVDLPHTWNAQDALAGVKEYGKGVGHYEKKLYIDPAWKGKRLFLRFEGANRVTNVFINGHHVGEHRGGYGAFIFEITDQVEYGKGNDVMVRVNNADQLDIMPLTGDFNFYGGIYRDVNLLITEKACISPLDYASSGVYLIQQAVNREEARVTARVILSNGGDRTEPELVVRVKKAGSTVIEQRRKVVLLAGKEYQCETVDFTLKKPHLWHGRKDPFMYQVEVELVDGGMVADRVVQPLGLRYFHTDPEKGFFLNGEHLSLHGVCRHQDRAERGSALLPEHHREDVEMMLEMGVNAVRLAHYPQAEYMYDLMDKYGFTVWAEIPFVGHPGFVDQVSFRANGEEQLKEMIRQHYNHPSICFWGIFNELDEKGDSPVTYLKQLNQLAHREDPTRLTTAASDQLNANLNLITDNIAWNRYYGWYGGMPEDMGVWLDKTHVAYPHLKIGVSEYGAGASIYQQQDSLVKSVARSWWHPENWQTYYHMENWKIISSRPYVWGSFVWNMFDFGAAHRREGDRPGINDKGLVTFDRKVRKDAFYFYKANWNKDEPMIHLAEKRITQQTKALQTFVAFTNREEAELFVNGKSYGKRKADNYALTVWEKIPLQKGGNKVRVETSGCNPMADEVLIFYGE